MSGKKPSEIEAERRAEERGDATPLCHAIVRVSGIPVQQFRLKDISQNGTCFLVSGDSVVLRNLAVGQEIEIQFHFHAPDRTTVFHRSEITHITKAPQGPYAGHCLVGVRILSQLKIS